MVNKQNNGIESDLYRVVITSIGRALPASAVAVAQGLAVPALKVVKCLYTAPATLVDDVEYKVAEQLVELLNSIGYESEMMSIDQAEPEESELYDVALYLTDAEKMAGAVNQLASFLGMSEADATRVLIEPPGVALGGISWPTVMAFKQHMKNYVEVTASTQNNARYEIFLNDLPAVTEQRLFADLAASGIELIAKRGLIASDITAGQLESVWQRYKANPALKVVNQAFLRFDIQLEAQAMPLTKEQVACLLQHTDIPVDMVQRVAEMAPVTIIESLAKEQLKHIFDHFSQANVLITANLVTFQTLGLTISEATDLNSINEILNAFSVEEKLQTLPSTLSCVFPEIQARVIRSALESNGALVELVA